MRNIVVKAVFIILAGLLSSCASSAPDESEAVNNVLDKAGHNRGELEKVLRHYSDDSLKLAAARWLIVNMPGHYSFDGPQVDMLDSIFRPLKSYAVNFSLDPEVVERWNSQSFADFTRKDHVRYIKADMLIRNIDMAFQEWQNRKWNHNLTFDEFCELLLPYTLGDARLSDWRTEYASHYRPKLDSAYSGDDVVEAASVLLRIIQSEGWIYNAQLITPHLDPSLLLDVRIGYNRDFIDMLVYAMRACGIPVAIDQLLISPDNKNSHKWIVVKDDETGRYIPFGVDSMEPNRNIHPHDGRKKGKVYRTTYARQNDHIKQFENIRSLPLRVVNPNIIDVSTEYFEPDSVKIHADSQGEDVYLALPVMDEWRPIDAGRKEGDSVTFYNYEAGVYYVPVIPKDNLFYPCGYPFFKSGNGQNIVLEPNVNKTVRIKMTRLMPMRPITLSRIISDMVGVVIEADTNEDFSNPDTILVVRDTIVDRRHRYAIPYPNKTYGYIRYTAAPGQQVSLAELEFYADKAETMNISYTVPDPVVERSGPQYLYDKNYESRFTIPVSDASFIMKLSRPTQIKSMRLTARNDGYFAVPGNEYRLYYLDGANGWINTGDSCMADKEGTLSFLVPENALLKLRDITDGLDYQVFTVQKGKTCYAIDLGFYNLVK